MRPLSLLLIWLAIAGAIYGSPSQVRGGPQLASQVPSSTAALKLGDLERMALELNPTIAQAAKFVQAAVGRRTQAGLYPNPVVGYEAEELSLESPGQRSQNYLFLEQRIVTAGKIGRRQDVQSRLIEQSETRLELQRIRLLNDVRVAFFRALGAQETVRLRRELTKIARDAVDVSEQLFNIGQADQPDVLAVEVEAEKAELDLENAGTELERSWAALTAVVGNPELPRATLEGELEPEPIPLDPDKSLKYLLQESPQVKLARNQVERTKASLTLAKAQRIPDVILKGGLGYSQEAKEVQAKIQVGISLPIFDRNQGAIAAASAELEAAQFDVRRIELTLRSGFESALRDYKNALQKTERYSRKIIPRAQKAHDLYLARFREMTASYPQVLIAQRTLFQSRADYIEVLVNLRQSLVLIQGMLLSGGLQFSAESPSSERAVESMDPAVESDGWR